MIKAKKQAFLEYSISNQIKSGSALGSIQLQLLRHLPVTEESPMVPVCTETRSRTVRYLREKFIAFELRYQQLHDHIYDVIW